MPSVSPPILSLVRYVAFYSMKKVVLSILIVLGFETVSSQEHKFEYSKKDTLSRDVFYKQIETILENQKILRRFTSKDLNGDQAIFIFLAKYQEYSKSDPIILDGIKYYIGNDDFLFFHDLPTTLSLVSITHCRGWTEYELIGSGIYLSATFIYVYDKQGIMSKQVLASLNVYKLKRIKNAT